MLFYILVFLIVILCTVSSWKNRKLWILSKKLKTDIAYIPGIGHAYKFLGNEEDLAGAIQCFGREGLKHGGITSWWMGNLHIGVSDPMIAECILNNLLEKGKMFKQLGQIYLGNGNLFAPVNIWRPRRKVLATNFSSKRLNQFIQTFSTQSNVMVEQLQSKVNTGPFPIWHYLTTYTLDTIFELTTGRTANSQENHNHPLLQNLEIGAELFAKRVLSPWLYNDIIYKCFPDCYSLKKCIYFYTKFIGDIIKATRNSMRGIHIITPNIEGVDSEENLSVKTFLEMLIERSGGENGFTDVELQEEISIVILAATDTSAVGSAFTILMLSRHPEVQDKVYKELKEVFGDSTRAATPEDLPRLKYLEAVIKESLRLYPPVPVILRQSDEDFQLRLIWAIHRNQKYWGEDAESFRPERFLDTPLKHPAQFIPFSYGPRNCVGYRYAMMSMKTNLSILLRNYKVLPETPAAPNGEHKPLKLRFAVMMKDCNNFMIQLESRNKL